MKQPCVHLYHSNLPPVAMPEEHLHYWNQLPGNDVTKHDDTSERGLFVFLHVFTFLFPGAAQGA